MTKSNFSINPDWVSERINGTPHFNGRKYAPWAFEFPGARHWPYGTVENKEVILRRPRSLRNFTWANSEEQPQTSSVYIHRSQSAIPAMHLSSQDQDDLHRPAAMKLTEKHSTNHRWQPRICNWVSTTATPVSGYPSYTYSQQNQQMAPQYTQQMSYQSHERHLMNPECAEYFDHEAIPPSNPRVYREPVVERLTPLDYTTSSQRRHTVLPSSKPFTNFVSFNWVR